MEWTDDVYGSVDYAKEVYDSLTNKLDSVTEKRITELKLNLERGHNTRSLSKNKQIEYNLYCKLLNNKDDLNEIYYDLNRLEKRIMNKDKLLKILFEEITLVRIGDAPFSELMRLKDSESNDRYKFSMHIEDNKIISTGVHMIKNK